tara:strand:+ start:419 stop:994 length:576 start_codon:yes stop_codon:yes gene_type:complete
MALAIPPEIRSSDMGVTSCLDLNQEETKKIIALHKDDSTFHRKGKVQNEDSNVIDFKKREVDVFVIHEKHEWVDELLILGAKNANELFQFNLTGILERPQLLRYSAPSIGYGWHLDIGTGDHSTRKISISVCLNSDYDGGELAFFMTGEQTIKPDAGTGIAFPSFMPHRVTPVTKGERWALVCWITGEPFR